MVRAMCLSGRLCLVAGQVFGYAGEGSGAPDGGERVSTNVEFYIDADGGPEPEEFFLIEVATDPEFESVTARFDSRQSKAGWVFGDLLGMDDDVPEKYRPQNFEGIHFRARGRLRDGEYYWRARKALGGGDWQPVDGEGHFFVDTLPPAPVDSLELATGESGEIHLSWSPVLFDKSGESEEVRGYRVYQYERLLRRYPVMTRYLVGETESTEAVLPPIEQDSRRIVFYRVRAVDAVGNEDGRRRPAPIGSLDMQLHPSNLDQLADPDYLRRMAREDEP